MSASTPTDREIGALVAAGADALGLPLDGDMRDRLVAYLRLIEQWNRTYNLTAIRDPRAMAVQHILDCLAVVAPLQRRLGSAPREFRLADIGSGAGLPGLVIGLTVPSAQVVCVDSVGKKAAFITHAAGALSLTNVSAVHGRVEALPGPPFDVVASRAFASLADVVAGSRHLLADRGWWLAMKGRVSRHELAMPGIEFDVEPVVVPGMSAERCIVWMRLRK